MKVQSTSLDDFLTIASYAEQNLNYNYMIEFKNMSFSGGSSFLFNIDVIDSSLILDGVFCNDRVFFIMKVYSVFIFLLNLILVFAVIVLPQFGGVPFIAIIVASNLSLVILYLWGLFISVIHEELAVDRFRYLVSKRWNRKLLVSKNKKK